MPDMRAPCALLLAAVAAAGCAADPVARADTTTRDRVTAARDLAAGSRDPNAPANRNVAVVADGVWMNTRGVDRPHGTPLPAKLERADGVTLAASRPASLQQVAAKITDLTGIPVTVAMAPAPDRRNTPAPTNPPAATDVPGLGGAAQGAAGGDGPARVRLDYSGPLSGLLDLLAARFGVNWRHADGTIHLYRLRTRTFNVAAIPGAMRMGSDLSTGTETSGDSETSQSTTSGSDTSHTLAQEARLTFWADLETALNQMAGDAGDVTVSQAMGSVTVRGPDPLLRRVAGYIERTNRNLNKMVNVDVTIIDVVLEDNRAFGLDVQAMLADPERAGLEVEGVTPFGGVMPNAVAYTVRQTDPDRTTSGSRAIFQALATRAEASVRRRTTLRGRNLSPMPLQKTRSVSYLSRVNVTTDQDGDETSELEPGVVVEGFSLQLLPHVLTSNRLLMRVGVHIANLDEIATRTSGNSTIQLPEVSINAFSQELALTPGDAMVVAAYEFAGDNTERRGTMAPDDWFLGGARRGGQAREAQVIVLEPSVEESPLVRHRTPSRGPRDGA